MNDFLSQSRHLLVPLLFHEVTSLHPPSFQRNDFSTCHTYTGAAGGASAGFSGYRSMRNPEASLLADLTFKWRSNLMSEDG